MPKELRYLLIGLVLGGVIIYWVNPGGEGQKEVIADTEPERVESRVPTELETQINNGTIAGYALPEEFSFAGELVPLHRADVKERLDREVQVNAFWHSNAILIIKRANKWLPTIDSILQANEVPTDFKYLAVAESGLQNVISPSNAVGFWQFLKGTAKDFGLTVNSEVDERYDPVLSTVAASKYLKKAHQKFGNWTLVAASYNMGMRAASEVIRKQNAETYYDMIMSEEPSRYVFRIIALKNLLEDPTAFSFQVDEKDLYQLPETKQIIVTQSISDWNEFAQKHGMTFYQLKQLNPWIRDYKLTVRSGQKYTVEVTI